MSKESKKPRSESSTPKKDKAKDSKRSREDSQFAGALQTLEYIYRLNNSWLQETAKTLISELQEAKDILSPKAWSLLRQLVTFKHPVVRAECSWLLLSLYTDNGADILNQLGWKSVMDVIKTSPGGGSLLAGALALDEQNGGQVVDELYSYVLDWANSPECSVYHSEIVIALSNIALNKKGVMLLVRNNVVHVIAQFLRQSNPQLTSHIITLIQNLSFSSHPRVVANLRKGKLNDVVVPFILQNASTDEEAVDAACIAYSNLVLPTDASLASILDGWVKSTSAKRQSNAIYTISNLAFNNAEALPALLPTFTSLLNALIIESTHDVVKEEASSTLSFITTAKVTSPRSEQGDLSFSPQSPHSPLLPGPRSSSLSGAPPSEPPSGPPSELPPGPPESLPPGPPVGFPPCLPSEIPPGPPSELPPPGPPESLPPTVGLPPSDLPSEIPPGPPSDVPSSPPPGIPPSGLPPGFPPSAPPDFPPSGLPPSSAISLPPADIPSGPPPGGPPLAPVPDIPFEPRDLPPLTVSGGPPSAPLPAPPSLSDSPSVPPGVALLPGVLFSHSADHRKRYSPRLTKSKEKRDKEKADKSSSKKDKGAGSSSKKEKRDKKDKDKK